MRVISPVFAYVGETKELRVKYAYVGEIKDLGGGDFERANARGGNEEAPAQSLGMFLVSPTHILRINLRAPRADWKELGKKRKS